MATHDVPDDHPGEGLEGDSTKPKKAAKQKATPSPGTKGSGSTHGKASAKAPGKPPAGDTKPPKAKPPAASEEEDGGPSGASDADVPLRDGAGSSDGAPAVSPEESPAGSPLRLTPELAVGGDDLVLPPLGVPGIGEFDELGPVLDDDVVEGIDDFGDDEDEEFEDDDDLEEGEEDGDAEGGARARAAAPKKRKVTEEDAEVALPDTPVPTEKKMLAALEKAFEGQDDVDATLLAKFTQHALALLETNRVMNLTAITDPREVAVKHYLDSWRITRMVPLMARRVLDLGSGGGFPGIPIALAEPMCSVILCESITKKARFLEEIVAKLGLRNVRVVNERAEDYLARERVDLVVVRAVSSVRENIRTLRKVRHALQDLVMFKGNSWGREVRAAEREAERLGFKLDTVLEHDLPEDMGRHAILVYRAPGGAGF